MYAEDTTLLSRDTDFIILVNVGNTELKLFYDLAHAYRLSSNVDNTFWMLFGNRSVDIDAPNFVLSNVQIEAKSSSRFLGIFLDDKI